MPTQLEISNSAISLVGGIPISAITDTDRNGLLCALHYPEARKFVVGEREWTFATKDAYLSTPDVVAPVGWGYGFNLPTDHLRLTKVSKDGDFTRGHTLNFDVTSDDTNVILLTDAEVCYIRYIWDQENIDMFIPQLVIALTHKLASLICNTITASRTLKQDLDHEYNISIAAAAAADGRQRMTQRTKSDTFLKVRSGYGF